MSNPEEPLHGGSTMSKTLNLADRLLAMGRSFQAMGRTRDAYQVLTRLASFRELPDATAEEALVRLAEIDLQRQKYKQSRRHLSAALVLHPDAARYHYLLAMALDLDEEGDHKAALKHYRRSLELDPNQPDCLSDFGLLAICLGETDEGMAALRRAVDLAPDDLEISSKLVEALCQLERPEEARLTLRAALFRNPRNCGFRKLCNDFEFQQLHDAQESARQQQSLDSVAEGTAAVLPFVRPLPQEMARTDSRRTIRCNAASRSLSSQGVRPMGADKKHA
jgi:tetratricopeptide (TPR) repeat protein